MSEETKDEVKQPNDGRPYLMIIVQEDGSIKVSGWINNKLIAYGLLTAAHDSIRDFIDKQTKIEKVQVNGSMFSFLLGKR